MAILTWDILLRAVIVRSIFFLHCVLCVWRVVLAREEADFWALLLIPLLLLPECALTLKFSKMGEWETFRPCIFIYLVSVVPNIWMLEHKLLEDRLSGVIDGMNVSVCTAGMAGMAGAGPDGDDESGGLFNFNVTILDVQIPFPELGSANWSVALQQVLLFVLIVGGWMLPRGKHLGHDELSNVLLLQIAMAADMLEFLSEGVRTDEVLCIKPVIFATLVLWSVSLLQLPFNFDSKAIRRKMNDFANRLSSNRSTLKRFANGEVWATFSAVILQDLPFLCLRFFFLFNGGILNQGLIFFIAKNILVILLQFYRLYALLCIEVDATGRASNRLVHKIRASLRGGRRSPKDRRTQDDAERAGTDLYEVKTENGAGDHKPETDGNHRANDEFEECHTESDENKGHENKGHEVEAERNGGIGDHRPETDGNNKANDEFEESHTGSDENKGHENKGHEVETERNGGIGDHRPETDGNNKANDEFEESQTGSDENKGHENKGHEIKTERNCGTGNHKQETGGNHKANDECEESHTGSDENKGHGVDDPQGRGNKSHEGSDLYRANAV